MPTDNTDSVSMDFRITEMPFWPIEYQSTPVNMDKWLALVTWHVGGRLFTAASHTMC